MKVLKITLVLSFLFFSLNNVFAQGKISGQWFLGFQHKQEENRNQFNLKRAYISYKYQINPWMKVRITPDITIDKIGEDKGDIKFRLKYLYVQFNVKDFSFFTDNNFKVGVTGCAWTSYEQKINVYRAAGTMFLNRAGVLNASDFGITFSSKLGGDFENKNYRSAGTGKYGDIVIGVFNGGGYHQLEENNNKTLDWRLTLRPLPNFLPGLLASYHGIFGKGNSTRNNRYQLNGYNLVYEHQWFVLSAQYYTGIGNPSDTFINQEDESPISHKGYSFFAEFKEPKTKLGVWARYDNQYKNFKNNNLSHTEERIILSAVWHFYKNNKFILSRDYFISGVPDEYKTIWEATLDIRF